AELRASAGRRLGLRGRGHTSVPSSSRHRRAGDARRSPIPFTVPFTRYPAHTDGLLYDIADVKTPAGDDDHDVRGARAAVRPAVVGLRAHAADGAEHALHVA